MLILLRVDEVVFWLTVGALAIVAPILGSMIADRLVTPVRVKVVDGSRGVVRLWFRNKAFLESASTGAMVRP